MQSPWLTDVRKVALLNCIFSFLSVLVPIEKLVVQVNAITLDHPDWSVWLKLALVAVILLPALFLTFFWALYRDRAKIALPAHLRLVALGAVIVLLVIGIRAFGQWSFGIRDDWSFVTHQEWRTGAQSLRGWLQDPVTMREFANSTGTAAAVSYVFFLIALFRQSDGFGRLEVPATRFLAVVTKICLTVAGLILAFLIIRVLMTPYLHSQLREMAERVGRNPPSFLYLIGESTRDLLLGACYSAAPFLVHMSIRPGRDSQIEEGRTVDS